MRTVYTSFCDDKALQTPLKGGDTEELIDLTKLSRGAYTVNLMGDGKIIATMLHGMASYMHDTGQTASITLMYAIQTLINIVIPSGSAKAALTMPIMAPFSDLIGLSRQATILAFQFGDGFTNMITPTSGVLIGCLGMARIPYHKWFSWVKFFILILLITGFLLLLPTVFMELPGFW